uniref:Uncharacterized protein n=1 Tax=Faxonius propinquus nudivirus TaxID=3139431 RepID=A0AAU8GBK2_9VIRU
MENTIEENTTHIDTKTFAYIPINKIPILKFSLLSKINENTINNEIKTPSKIVDDVEVTEMSSMDDVNNLLIKIKKPLPVQVNRKVKITYFHKFSPY